MLHAALELRREAETKMFNSTVPCLPDPILPSHHSLGSFTDGKAGADPPKLDRRMPKRSTPFYAATALNSGCPRAPSQLISGSGLFEEEPRSSICLREDRVSRPIPPVRPHVSFHEAATDPMIGHAVEFDHAVARPCWTKQGRKIQDCETASSRHSWILALPKNRPLATLSICNRLFTLGVRRCWRISC